MFNNYQTLEIQNAIRNFLWFDGKGNRKMHAVKWDRCHTTKLLGGPGLKTFKIKVLLYPPNGSFIPWRATMLGKCWLGTILKEAFLIKLEL